MTPIIFKKVIFNSGLQRVKSIQQKKKFMVINRRKFYNFPNGPEEPDYIMMVMTALSSYFALQIFYKK